MEGTANGIVGTAKGAVGTVNVAVGSANIVVGSANVAVGSANVAVGTANVAAGSAKVAQRRPNAQLTHLGFMVSDLEQMIGFYTRVLGMVLTDRGPYYRGGEIAFLSRNPAEHHQLVLASGRPAEMPTIINQISFIVDDLEELREFHTVVVDEKVNELAPRNHGNAWSIYFSDPEGNRIELYTPSPWHVGQPYGRSLDLTAPAEAIREQTLEMIRNDPTFTSREAWQSAMKTRIAGARIAR